MSLVTTDDVLLAAATCGVQLPAGACHAPPVVLSLDAWGELGVDGADDHLTDQADIVVLHRVVSRTDLTGRTAAFIRARALLRPGGIVVADYAALPGWRRFQPVRELLQLAWGDRHAVLRSAAAVQPEGSIQHGLLSLALDRLRDVDAAPDEPTRRQRELDHELATGHDPLSVRDIADVAHAAGLRYLGELEEAHRAWQSKPAAERIRGLAGSDPVAQQLFVDLAAGVAYKHSMFVAT